MSEKSKPAQQAPVARTPAAPEVVEAIPRVRRGSAYLTLWALLALVIWWRQPPRSEVRRLPPVTSLPVFQVDVNHAPWDQLLLIEGIGETLARRIVEARELRGGFDSWREVMELRGVPDRPFEDPPPWLVLGSKSSDSK